MQPMKIAIASNPDTDHQMLSKLISEVSDDEMLWVTEDEGKICDLCINNKPDLLLLDIAFSEKPSDCVRCIQERSPCVILLIATKVEGNEPAIFEAMRWGALDVATIPASLKDKKSCRELMHKVDIMHTLADTPLASRVPKKSDAISLVVIGASTGGPNAIRTILADMPKDFEGNIIIVQHIDAEFLPGMASWLNGHTSLDVQVAKDGDTLKKGKVLIAQGPDDLIITKKRTLKYIKPKPNAAFIPSIDIFFTSCVENLREKGVTVILSGMGKDGALGMKAMSEAGWETIAQDEASSTIYGMPKEAASTGAAKHILAIDKIAKSILKFTQH
jgi:two-component system response regulator WspF